MASMEEIAAMFEQTVLKPSPAKKFADIDDRIKKAKAAARQKKGYQSGNGTEYVKVWNKDGSDFKYITKARVKWAEYHGRAVEPHEVIFFRDKKLKGEEKYTKDNLLLGFRAGISLDLLTCRNCGCRGLWEIGEAPTGEREAD